MTQPEPPEFADFYREYLGRLVTYLTYQGAPAHIAAELAQEAMTGWLVPRQRFGAVRMQQMSGGLRSFVRFPALPGPSYGGIPVAPGYRKRPKLIIGAGVRRPAASRRDPLRRKSRGQVPARHAGHQGAIRMKWAK